jgi:hypothetical protein
MGAVTREESSKNVDENKCPYTNQRGVYKGQKRPKGFDWIPKDPENREGPKQPKEKSFQWRARSF